MPMMDDTALLWYLTIVFVAGTSVRTLIREKTLLGPKFRLLLAIYAQLCRHFIIAGESNWVVHLIPDSVLNAVRLILIVVVTVAWLGTLALARVGTVRLPHVERLAPRRALACTLS